MLQRLILFLSWCLIYGAVTSCDKKETICTVPEECPSPEYAYGFSKDHYAFTQFLIQRDEFLADILLDAGVSYKTIHNIAEASREVFDVRNLRVGKPYTLIYEDPCGSADYMVYEPSAYRYVVYDLDPSRPRVKMITRAIDHEVETAQGTITSSLWNAMVDIDAPWSLISKMEDALAWSLDFHNVQPQDSFKLVFEREYIDGEPVGIGNLLAAYYKNNNEYYSIYYEGSKHPGYFDETGRSMQRAFLKSPVKYSVISSAYNLRRFHPVLKRVKAHRGTDYAAPYGTPIMSVSAGVVTHASRTRGNGNNVNVKSDKVYTPK